MHLKDKRILCLCCGDIILLTASKRIEYKKKNYRNPCYCKNCRYIAHQAERQLIRRIHKFTAS